MKKYITPSLAALAMLAMILDTRTALSGAEEGLALCIHTIIPSLFPFFVLSALLTGSMSSFRFRLLRPLGLLCRLPKGSEGLLLLGLVGGYPSGAQNIAQSFACGGLTEKDAKRLLGFCSNAGPAFLFGIVSAQFPSPKFAWILWGIHIVSAILTGILLSGKAQGESTIKQGKQITLPTAMTLSLRSTAGVCGWVIIFRVLMGFLEKWIGQYLSPSAFGVMSGLLELSIGCCNLKLIENVGLRFVVCAVLLGFGGLCVLMQTISVTGKLGPGAYFPGKLLQAALSFQLAYQAQLFLLPREMRLQLPLWLILSVWLSLLSFKITVAIRRIIVYNPNTFRNKRSCICCFAKISQKHAIAVPMAPATRRE